MSDDSSSDATTSRNGSKIRFEPINQLRAHEYVAEQIRRHIALGLLNPGDALPAERELAVMFGVGRPTVQHALRLLEADRLVGARRGRYGGTFVLGTEDETLQNERMMLLLRQREEIEELLVYRRCLEPRVAGLAATRRTPTDIAALHRTSDTMQHAVDEAEYNRADTEYHLAIATATQNQFILTQSEEIRMRLFNALSLLPESDQWHERVNDEHAAITTAIEAGDIAQAQEHMDAHIAHSERAVRASLRALDATFRRMRP